jgi:ABC-type transport system involved in cytochrome c biogenesis ATPase subunit
VSEPLLAASGVRHAFGRARVLDGVDLELPRGRLLVVVGPNGAGKTTLLRVLAGTLRADEGAVRLGGVPLAALSRREVARRLAVVPQESLVPFPFRVREMVALGRAPFLGPLGREGASDVALTELALGELALEPLAERAYPTLSGGEKQRVLLARWCGTSDLASGRADRTWTWPPPALLGVAARVARRHTRSRLPARDARSGSRLSLRRRARAARARPSRRPRSAGRGAHARANRERLRRGSARRQGRDGRLSLSPVRSLPVARGQDPAGNIG